MNEEFRVLYPFYRGRVTIIDEDGPCELDSWIPGTDSQFVHPYDFEPVAHGMGEQILTVVSRHKPGRYPERVFYERRWVAPDGKEFGKPGLHIATVQKFNRLCRGFGYEFRLENNERVERGSPLRKENEPLTVFGSGRD